MEEVNLDDLKEKIDIVEYIGRIVDLNYENGEWWGLCPLHNEHTPSFSVSQEKRTYFCHGCKSGGSVIDFASNYFKITIPQAINKLADEYKISRNSIPSIMRVSKRFAPKHKEKKEVTPMKYVNNPMDSYEKSDIVEWIEEGIPQEIMDKYEVRYDRYDNRIVFPIKDNDGNLISIKGRTLDPDFKAKKIRKYAYYTKIGTTDFLYAYFMHKDCIKEKNEMIIFEGEKSVMKAESYGWFNCVASLTDSISGMVDKIIEMPCRDIVIAWDKGVSRSHIMEEVKFLKKYKNIYVIKDINDVVKPANDQVGFLDDKDAPVDKGKEVFEYLYSIKERIL